MMIIKPSFPRKGMTISMEIHIQSQHSPTSKIITTKCLSIQIEARVVSHINKANSGLILTDCPVTMENGFGRPHTEANIKGLGMSWLSKTTTTWKEPCKRFEMRVCLYEDQPFQQSLCPSVIQLPTKNFERPGTFLPISIR